MISAPGRESSTTSPPTNVVTGADLVVEIRSDPIGIPGSALTAGQQDLLMAVIESYVGIMADDIAALRRASILAGGIDDVRFAWAGPTERGKVAYYRRAGTGVPHRVRQHAGGPEPHPRGVPGLRRRPRAGFCCGSTSRGCTDGSARGAPWPSVRVVEAGAVRLSGAAGPLAPAAGSCRGLLALPRPVARRRVLAPAPPTPGVCASELTSLRSTAQTPRPRRPPRNPRISASE